MITTFRETCGRKKFPKTAVRSRVILCQIFFFYQNIDYIVQTNNLQLTKINQNKLIQMSQTINITLQPMQ